mgnify:CR=1 FL=1
MTSRANSRSERSAASTGMFDGVKCSEMLSRPPTLSLNERIISMMSFGVPMKALPFATCDSAVSLVTWAISLS